MAPPTLATARLVLRPHRSDDFEACCRLWAEPDVTRFIGGRPSTPEEVWSRLLRYAGLWSMLGLGYFAVTDKETGAYLGELGLADFRRDLSPSFGTAPEAGWALLPEAQGHGFAREALGAVLAWADAVGIARIVCMIDPVNTPSIRLAQAVGFAGYARTTYKEASTILFARER